MLFGFFYIIANWFNRDIHVLLLLLCIVNWQLLERIERIYACIEHECVCVQYLCELDVWELLDEPGFEPQTCCLWILMLDSVWCMQVR